MQDTEIDIAFGEKKIRHPGNDGSPPADNKEPLFDQMPLYAGFMYDGEADSHTDQKKRNDQPWQAEPERVLEYVDPDKPEQIQVVGQVEKDHQKNCKSPQSIQQEIALGGLFFSGIRYRFFHKNTVGKALAACFKVEQNHERLQSVLASER